MASKKYYKTLSAIQRSDQKLCPFSDVLPVWRNKTSSSPSRDSIGYTRKTVSRKYYKSLSSIQRSDQNLWPFLVVISVRRGKPSLQRVRIP
jgi:hypothetical protein